MPDPIVTAPAPGGAPAGDAHTSSAPAPAAPAAPAAPSESAAGAAPTAEAAPVTPAAPVAPATPTAEPAAPAATPEAPAPAAPAAEAKPETKPANEFAPTLIESAAPDKPAEVKPDAAPGDKKPADGKDAPPPATTEAQQAPPIEYAFTWPEDIKSDQIKQERMSELTGILGESKVSPESAQKLLDMHLAEIREVQKRVQDTLSQRQWDVFRNQQNTWKDEVMADPELGGSRFQTAMRTCATVIEQYGGTPEEQKALWDDLRATGMGNSPRLLKLFHRLGNSFGREATMIPASQPRTVPQTRQQRGEARYAGSRG